MRFPLPRIAFRVLAALCCLTCLSCALGPAGYDAQGETVATLREKGAFRVGVLRRTPPISYTNAAGDSEGFEADLARSVARKALGEGVPVVFVHLDASERLAALAENRVDALFACLFANEKAPAAALGEPYLVARLGVLSPAGKRISALMQLSGKRLAVVRGSAAESYFQKHGGLRLIRTASTAEAFAALKGGLIDAFAHDNIILAGLAANASGYVLGIPAFGGKKGIVPAVRSESPALLRAVNEAIMALEAEGYFLTLYAKHMARYGRYGLTPDSILPAMGALR